MSIVFMETLNKMNWKKEFLLIGNILKSKHFSKLMSSNLKANKAVMLASMFLTSNLMSDVFADNLMQFGFRKSDNFVQTLL